MGQDFQLGKETNEQTNKETTNKPIRGGFFSPLFPPEGKNITGSKNSVAKMTPNNGRYTKP
jgi:hypothetical protein